MVDIVTSLQENFLRKSNLIECEGANIAENQ
jgi:hypothetical protein